jgi:hypothetical protein
MEREEIAEEKKLIAAATVASRYNTKRRGPVKWHHCFLLPSVRPAVKVHESLLSVPGRRIDFHHPTRLEKG